MRMKFKVTEKKLLLSGLVVSSSTELGWAKYETVRA